MNLEQLKEKRHEYLKRGLIPTLDLLIEEMEEEIKEVCEHCDGEGSITEGEHDNIITRTCIHVIEDQIGCGHDQVAHEYD